MWFHVIQAFQGSNMPLPVNLKFIIEFMNHENSLGLSGFLQTRLQDFFAGVYNVVVCASQWIGPKHPCLIYGCVGQYNVFFTDGRKHLLFVLIISTGTLHFEVAIEKTQGSKTDIKNDMETIEKSLVDEKEKILIKGFEERVEQITPDEEQVYANIKDFNMDDIKYILPSPAHYFFLIYYCFFLQGFFARP